MRSGSVRVTQSVIFVAVFRPCERPARNSEHEQGEALLLEFALHRSCQSVDSFVVKRSNPDNTDPFDGRKLARTDWFSQDRDADLVIVVEPDLAAGPGTGGDSDGDVREPMVLCHSRQFGDSGRHFLRGVSVNLGSF